MKASDMLRSNNGLKTTQSVLNKQQSGVDAAQKVGAVPSHQQVASDLNDMVGDNAPKKIKA